MPSISAVAGKSLTIKCPAAGYPIDSIVWEKGNAKLVCVSGWMVEVLVLFSLNMTRWH